MIHLIAILSAEKHKPDCAVFARYLQCDLLSTQLANAGQRLWTINTVHSFNAIPRVLPANWAEYLITRRMDQG